MNGRVSKRLRKAAQFVPSEVRRYEKQKHTTHFPMFMRKPDGTIGTEWMPKVSFQTYCIGPRYNYLQSKKYYKLIRQGRIAHASSMFAKRINAAIESKVNEQQDSESVGTKEKIKSNTDRPTNETRN
jgi:hypothetical protein